MTSAARPTWSAALGSGGGLRDGSSAAPTLQTCAKDQPGHLKLKLRQTGQDSPEDLLSRNFSLKPTETPLRISMNLISGDSDEEINDSDNDNDNEKEDENFNETESKDQIFEDDENENENYNETDTETNNENYSDDEEEELMRELEKIRKERELEKIAKERKSAEQDPQAILAGNPLLSSTPITTESTSTFGAKRRWDDDVVFKNQAKGVDEKPQKRFINDTTRSDFHRRFMDKIIK